MILYELSLEELMLLKQNQFSSNEFSTDELEIEFPVTRAIDLKIEKMRNIPVDCHKWYTFYIMVVDREAVGMIGFKGIRQDNSIEIGYGVSTGYRRKGYATKAIELAVNIAKTNPAILVVTANNVLIDNYGSIKALEHNNFIEVSRTKETINFYYNLTM